MSELMIAHLNVRSLLPKMSEVAMCVSMHGIDVFCVSETWLSVTVPNDAVSIDGYHFFRRDRDGRGGGVGVYVRSDLNGVLLGAGEYCEQVWVSFGCRSKKYVFGCVYRAQTISEELFINELEDQLLEFRLNYDSVFCLGDVNVNILDGCAKNTVRLLSAFGALGMEQLIVEPTRVTANTATLLDNAF